MWQLSNDYTIELARRFLLDDFLKVVRRTRFLYVDTVPPITIGHGYYEPVILSLCWCDFLGALYCGDGEIGHTARSKRFIEEVMGRFNPRYSSIANHLVKTYQHGPVHAYAPEGNFNILISNDAEHLNEVQNPYCLKLSVKTLLDDLENSVIWYANNLNHADDARAGSIEALNNARRDLLNYTTEPDT